MFKNYLKIAVRNLKTYKSYSLINIFGLALGLTVCIFIMLWVQNELSYDHFHRNARQIYRVVFADYSYDHIRHYAVTPPALAKNLQKDFPEVLSSITYHVQEQVLVGHRDKKFKERIAFSDEAIFDIFTIPFLLGNPGTAFSKPYSVVITQKIAEKYFDDENPINKSLTLENNIDFVITGVINDLPENGFLNFDLIMPFRHLYTLTGRGQADSWDSFGYNTFVLFGSQINIPEIDQKIADYAINSHSYGTFKPKLYLQSLLDIHLYDLNGGGVIRYIYIFSFMALFILLIACINFMNLVTARSAVRTKEIGIRKVIGARRKNLIQQFLGESILLSFIALCFSLILVERLLPIFNELSGKNILLNAVMNHEIILYLVGITLLTGIISGIYPALFLSSLKPVSIFKSSKLTGYSKLRKFLVVSQFSLSIIMIMSTLVISNQLKYLNDQDLGFNKDHILYLPLNQAIRSKTTSLKNELKKNPQIHHVTVTSNKIGVSKFHSVDLNRWEGNIEEKSILLGLIYADYDFQNTFDIKMSSGRFYSEKIASDSLAVVLNESAINEMGLKEPIGKKVFENSYIIGVVKDFNFQSLHSAIGPLAIGMNQQLNRYLAIKIADTKIEESINYIKRVFKKITPDFPFEYHFLDNEFEKLYLSEQQLGRLFLSFSILAILISALGLLGLASFTAGQRTKEIGIRKVLGASVTGILILLSKDFLKWVVLANFIAWPMGWFIMNQWLKNFAYQSPVGLNVFLIAGSVSIIIALLTVSSQALKASGENPVKSLKYE